MRLLLPAFLLALLTACASAAPAQPSPLAASPAVAQAAGSQTDSTPLVATANVTALPSDGPRTMTLVYNVVEDGSLRALDLERGNEIVLGDPTAPGQRLPWSPAPDGRTLALVTGRGWGPKGPASGWTAALWTVNRDGSEPRRLLDLLPPDGIDLPPLQAGNLQIALTSFQEPVWTPDSSAIIVTSAHEGEVDLYAVARDGGEVRGLTRSPALEVRPSIAPDGREVAYLSTSSFGTGAGWGNVSVEAIPLGGGEPRGLLPPATGFPPASADILGWTRAGAAIVAAYYPQPGLIVGFAERETAPVAVYSGLGGLVAWNGAAERLAIAASDPAQADGGAALLLWRPGEGEPERVAALKEEAQPYWSPGGQALLLCATRHSPAELTLWDGDELKALGQAGCTDIHWSSQGQLAVSGGDVQGRVFGADGTPLGQLPPGARVAGWFDSDLYYFGPNGGQGWQLMLRAGHTEAPVGQPVPLPPERVEVGVDE